MRISGNVNSEPVVMKPQSNQPAPVESLLTQGSESKLKPKVTVEQVASTEPENNDDMKVKVQDAVNKMNEMLEVNKSTSKFMYHEGLDRYYVSIVNRETEEVVKEIPPKRLLDAFYEMQKMLGMVVDEKI